MVAAMAQDRRNESCQGRAKRPRTDYISNHDGNREQGNDEGCCCGDTGCPWRWQSSGSRESSTCLSSEEPSFFHGPLLSVKEYRHAATGGMMMVVFQGERRTPVAKILYTLNRGRGYGYVKVIEVADGFRGSGLGPLLFKEVFDTLARLSVTEVRLEAEEDMDRHNRLVQYYEKIGFRVVEGSKVLYINHDDQIYRKIPMHRTLNPAQPQYRRPTRLADQPPFWPVRLLARTGTFARSTTKGHVVPAAAHASTTAAAASSRFNASIRSVYTASGVALQGGGAAAGGGAAMCGGGGEAVMDGGGGPAGSCGGQASSGGGGGSGGDRAGTSDVDEDGNIGDHWILQQEVQGVVRFESAYGKFLCAEPDGKVVADRSWDNSWEHFHLERFPHPEERRCTYPGSSSKETVQDNDGDGGSAVPVSGGLRFTDKFALRTFHGHYLSLDAECGTVSASAQPVLWTADEGKGICYCEGAASWAAPPPASRRQVALQAHLQRMRQQQSVAFVSRVRSKYLNSFGSRGCFTIKEVLFKLNNHFDPLAAAPATLSVAQLMVLTAEDIREGGHPDWMQAIGLVHGLGRILHFLGDETGATTTERESVLGEYSWVVGAPLPNCITCPSYNAGNPDAADERFGAGKPNSTGMYAPGSGLNNALLCFSGPEYMHMVLRHNRIAIPEEGMAMLRLYPLEPWHAGGCYSSLESAADQNLKESVRKFDTIRRETIHDVTFHRREVDVEQAWEDHLGALADIYFPGKLEW